MDKIDKIFESTDRKLFLPEEQSGFSDSDRPLPIGFAQTNSQPSTVKMMLEWLEVEPGCKILDVGSGSGWTAALLSKLTGPTGKVYAVEIIPELVEFGRRNAVEAGIKNVRFFKAGKQFGLARYAPYDRILVSATTDELPKVLLAQLKVGGKMVIPVHRDILEITKYDKGAYETFIHPGFLFVPLVDPAKA